MARYRMKVERTTVAIAEVEVEVPDGVDPAEYILEEVERLSDEGEDRNDWSEVDNETFDAADGAEPELVG